jgi:hypothetical protein
MGDAAGALSASIEVPPVVARRTLLVVAGAAVGLAVVTIAIILANLYNIPNPDHTGHFPWITQALIWIFVGEFAWLRWPSSRVGPWMAVAGFAHFAYVPGLIPTSATWEVANLASGVELVVIAFLFLTYPEGRLRDRVDKGLLAVVAVWWATARVSAVLTSSHDLNPFPLVTEETAQNSVAAVVSLVSSVLLLVVAGRVVWRWRQMPLGRAAR